MVAIHLAVLLGVGILSATLDKAKLYILSVWNINCSDRKHHFTI